MSVQKECEHCGRPFRTPNRRSETVKFCSWECRKEHGWLTLECRACGSVFKRKRSDNASSERRYCSAECYHGDQHGKPNPGRPKVDRVSKICEQCKSVFLVIPSRENKSRFCSRKCQSLSPEWRAECSEKQAGDKHWRWSGGLYKGKFGYSRIKSKRLSEEEYRFVHRVVIERAMLESEPDHPFLVIKNGEKRLRSEIEVHHIDRDRSHNKLHNLLAVTKHAHAQIHHRNRKPLPNECWPRNPAKW